MKEIFNEKNMEISVKNLLDKKDSCGIDGIFISQYEEYWKMNKEKILDDLWNGVYKPDVVQMIELLKKNGKKRTISKYTCTDRVILDVIKREITPMWENKFSKFSFAYQENKGVQEAAKQAAYYIEQGNEWVVEIDIENFFDNINLSLLEKKLDLTISNKQLRRLIQKYLYIRIQVDRSKIKNKRGLIQGSPISPLLSNVYMNEFDYYIQEKYHFCRFSDNINIYCATHTEAEKIFNEVQQYLDKELGLKYNKKKSGIYSALTRKYLGYEFYKLKNNKKVYIRHYSYNTNNYYNKWHVSAIQKIDKNYHLINNGILTRKDYTILFENEEKKYYLPVETCGSINIYSQVIFSTSFFEYAKKKNLQINIYDKYGEYVGSFSTAKHYKATKTMLKQADLYNNLEKRLEIAKNIELASLYNQRQNLRYYNKHKKLDILEKAIKEMTRLMEQLKDCESIEALMLIEARAKQKYLQSFDNMISDKNFVFEKRTRRPPLNEVNAMISFGNVFLYRRIATELHKTPLDIRIGFVHAANNRSESLNLDIAEIFKPIIVDRAIFTAIHNMEINKEKHFEQGEQEGVYLNKEGKRIFIQILERKLYKKLSVQGKNLTYEALIREEIKKISKMVQYGEKYKAFKHII